MHKTRVLITVSCCLCALAIFAWAQAVRKPGLWEMTTKTTWQKPPEMNRFGQPPATQVCLTQAMIDKYGAPIPTVEDCHIVNVVMKANGMTADLICSKKGITGTPGSGDMTGKGTLESSWAIPDQVKGKVHVLEIHETGLEDEIMGPISIPFEYTIEFSSVYKGPNCGNIKPAPMPN